MIDAGCIPLQWKNVGIKWQWFKILIFFQKYLTDPGLYGYCEAAFSIIFMSNWFVNKQTQYYFLMIKRNVCYMFKVKSYCVFKVGTKA